MYGILIWADGLQVQKFGRKSHHATSQASLELPVHIAPCQRIRNVYMSLPEYCSLRYSPKSESVFTGEKEAPRLLQKI